MRIDPEVLAVRHPVLAAEMVKLQLEIGKRRIWARTYDGMRRCEGGRHQSPAEEKPFRTDFHAERQVSDEFVEAVRVPGLQRSEDHTFELHSLMRFSYAGFCLKKINMYIFT